ncbi:MAG: HEPN domain-containing protein [Caldivirga sp.]|uniref:HEPN domain-containing protein n=1 Tax=Caldivirga sp. TaxID=2080243 RepID=UPI003D0AC1FF
MVFESWLRKAERFRDYAREDLTNHRYDSAAFFAQQSVELLLKGILIRMTGSRPITYSVSELLQYLAKVLNKDLPNEVIKYAKQIESHYIQARYPDARLNDYRQWEAEEAVKCMNMVWDYVREMVSGLT